jgi:hypothetical protein
MGKISIKTEKKTIKLKPKAKPKAKAKPTQFQRGGSHPRRVHLKRRLVPGRNTPKIQQRRRPKAMGMPTPTPVTILRPRRILKSTAGESGESAGAE